MKMIYGCLFMYTMSIGMGSLKPTVNDQIDEALSFMEVTLRGVSMQTLEPGSVSKKLVIFNHYLNPDGSYVYIRTYPYKLWYLDKIQSMSQLNEYHQLASIAQGLKNNIPLHEHRVQLLAIQTARLLRFKQKIFEKKKYRYVPLNEYVNTHISKLDRAKKKPLRID